jgi:hypothetical protein
VCRNGDGDLTVTSACAVPPHAVEGGCLQAGDRDCVAERGAHSCRAWPTRSLSLASRRPRPPPPQREAGEHRRKSGATQHVLATWIDWCGQAGGTAGSRYWYYCVGTGAGACDGVWMLPGKSCADFA